MAPKLKITTEKIKNMEKKEKYIKLEKEKVKEIAAIKGVSTVAVYDALKFKTDSALAHLIRAWALNHGGKLFVRHENPYVEVTTL